MDGWTIVLLIVQAVLAIAALHVLIRIFTRLGDVEHPAAIGDVWAPIALVLPLLFLSGRVETRVWNLP